MRSAPVVSPSNRIGYLFFLVIAGVEKRGNELSGPNTGTVDSYYNILPNVNKIELIYQRNNNFFYVHIVK